MTESDTSQQDAPIITEPVSEIVPPDNTRTSETATTVAHTSARPANATESALPQSVDEWRAFLKTIKVADLLLVVNADKTRAGRIFKGFRPSGNTLRDNLVQRRIIDVALQEPVFAEVLWKVGHPTDKLASSASLSEPPEPASQTVSHTKEPKSTPNVEPVSREPEPVASPREWDALKKEVQALKEIVEKKRETLRERDLEIRELKGKLSETERERDRAVLAARKAREAQQTAELEVERLKQQLRRGERREKRAASSTLTEDESGSSSTTATLPLQPTGKTTLQPAVPPSDEMTSNVISSSLTTTVKAVDGTGNSPSLRLKAVPTYPAGTVGAILTAKNTQPPPTAFETQKGEPPKGEPLGELRSKSPESTALFTEALERLLARARYTTVAEVCREALMTESAKASAAQRGPLHALYAAALYGQGDSENGETQDRLAITAYLDSGQIGAAAEVFSRLLIQTRTVRKTDSEPLRRLLALAKRGGQEAEIAATFQRMRLRSRDAHRRLLELGGTLAQSLLTATASGITWGSDDPVMLPGYGPPLTPRRIVHAVDAGEEVLVARVREGIARLRRNGTEDTAKADALLEAVATLEPAAVEPLLRPETAPVFVDASNVARYSPDPLAMNTMPKVGPLKQMRDALLQRGFFPVYLVADANLRYHLDDPATFDRLVTRHIVEVVTPGTSADEEIIRRAQARNALVISNDRFTDHPDTDTLTRLGFHIAPGTMGLIRN